MKKIMLIAAAALAGAAFAEDITSNNIVGFKGSALNYGASNNRTLVVPQFTGIAKETIRLGDIKPVSSSAVTMNQVMIYTLKKNGTTDKTYRWTGATTGWKENNTDANDVEIPAGKGLWVSCSRTTDTTLQSSGEVNSTDDLVVTLNAGASNNRTAFGNGFPCDVTLGDITPVATTAGQSVTMNQVMIYTLKNNGTTDKTYRWTGATGWKENNTPAGTVVIPAGQGLWISCSKDPATSPVELRIKNPLVEE